MLKTAFVLAFGVSGFANSYGADKPDAKPPEPGLVVHADPSAMIPNGVEFRRDVAFLPPDRAEKLDLYLPKNRPAGTRSPAIVIIHGGAWKGGNKSAGREIDSGTTFALAGYVCASVEYDKVPGNWPRNLLDCKNAVRFLRAHAGELGVDGAHIGVIGGSAGGHLALMVAFTPHVAELEPSAPYPAVPDHVSACVNMYGPADLFLQQGVKEAVREGDKKLEMFDPKVTDLSALWRLASPVHHVCKDSPPVLILQGAKDVIVKPEQATLLDAKLSELRVEHQTVLIPETPHTFTLHSVKTMDIATLTVAFFDKHLKPKAKKP